MQLPVSPLLQNMVLMQLSGGVDPLPCSVLSSRGRSKRPHLAHPLSGNAGHPPSPSLCRGEPSFVRITCLCAIYCSRGSLPCLLSVYLSGTLEYNRGFILPGDC